MSASRPPPASPPATSSAWGSPCSALLRRCRRHAETPFALPRRVAKGGGERLEEALARPFLGAEPGQVVGVDLAVDEADAAPGHVLHEGDERHLRRVVGAREHGLAEKRAAEG